RQLRPATAACPARCATTGVRGRRGRPRWSCAPTTTTSPWPVWAAGRSPRWPPSWSRRVRRWCSRSRSRGLASSSPHPATPPPPPSSPCSLAPDRGDGDAARSADRCEPARTGGHRWCPAARHRWRRYRRSMTVGAAGPRTWRRSLAGGLALVVAYVATAWIGNQLGEVGSLTGWYPPAGLALAGVVVVGWPAVPFLAAGELITGVVVFEVDAEFTV